jgi:hypothetical protein
MLTPVAYRCSPGDQCPCDGHQIPSTQSFSPDPFGGAFVLIPETQILVDVLNMPLIVALSLVGQPCWTLRKHFVAIWSS